MSAAEDFALFDGIVASTRRQLEEFGGSPEEFLGVLMGDFVRAAVDAPHGAGARHMALSVFLLVRQQQVIDRLVEDVAWRDYALRVLSELQ